MVKLDDYQPNKVNNKYYYMPQSKPDFYSKENLNRLLNIAKEVMLYVIIAVIFLYAAYRLLK